MSLARHSSRCSASIRLALTRAGSRTLKGLATEFARDSQTSSFCSWTKYQWCRPNTSATWRVKSKALAASRRQRPGPACTSCALATSYSCDPSDANHLPTKTQATRTLVPDLLAATTTTRTRSRAKNRAKASPKQKKHLPTQPTAQADNSGCSLTKWCFSKRACAACRTRLMASC